jgi:hypothetical protein
MGRKKQMKEERNRRREYIGLNRYIDRYGDRQTYRYEYRRTFCEDMSL